MKKRTKKIFGVGLSVLMLGTFASAASAQSANTNNDLECGNEHVDGVSEQMDAIYIEHKAEYDVLEEKLDGLYAQLDASEESGDTSELDSLWIQIDGLEDELDALDEKTGMSDLYDEDEWDYEDLEDSDDPNVHAGLEKIEDLEEQIDEIYENNDHLFANLDEESDELFFELVDMRDIDQNSDRVVEIVKRLVAIDGEYELLEEQLGITAIDNEIWGIEGGLFDYADSEDYEGFDGDWNEDDFDDEDDDESEDHEFEDDFEDENDEKEDEDDD